MGKKQNTKSAGKWVTVSVALFLAFVLIVGLCLQVFATNEKFKPSEWFKKDEQTEELPEEGGENAFVQDKKENGIKLMSTQAASGSAYKGSYLHTATVLPEDADNKNVAWSIAWENPASAWATGKNVLDYMRATDMSSTDDLELNVYGTSYKVALTPKKAYGEMIVVTVKSQDDETKCATVKFGYLKTFKWFELFWQRDGVDYNDEIIHFGDGNTYSVRLEYELTDGTDTPDVDYTVSTVKIKQNGSGSLITGTPTYALDSKSFVCTEDWYQNFFDEPMSLSEFKRKMSAGIVTTVIVHVSFLITSDKTTNIKEVKNNSDLDLAVDLSYIVVPVNGVTVDQSGELYF